MTHIQSHTTNPDARKTSIQLSRDTVASSLVLGPGDLGWTATKWRLLLLGVASSACTILRAWIQTKHTSMANCWPSFKLSSHTELDLLVAWCRVSIMSYEPPSAASVCCKLFHPHRLSCLSNDWNSYSGLYELISQVWRWIVRDWNQVEITSAMAAWFHDTVNSRGEGAVWYFMTWWFIRFG